LEIGFRHFTPRNPLFVTPLAQAKHRLEIADVVFKSQKSEAITDLLLAWTARDESYELTSASLGSCVGHLVGLHSLVPFSSRSQQPVIPSVEIIGCEEFEGVGVERFVGLLDHLHVTVNDMDSWSEWGGLLLKILQTSEEAQQLSHLYWELLVELAISWSWPLQNKFTYSPQIVRFLVETQEWS
jgi:hypothetical protein